MALSPIGGGGQTRSATVVADRLRDSGHDGTGPLDRLLHRPGALDRLVADAGPLGRFMVGREDALPAGTSAYTKRAVDTLNGVEAKLGLPRERVLANANMPMPLPGNVVPAADIAPGGTTRTPVDSAIGALRPAIATDAGNTVAGGTAGNSAAVRA